MFCVVPCREGEDMNNDDEERKERYVILCVLTIGDENVQKIMLSRKITCYRRKLLT